MKESEEGKKKSIDIIIQSIKEGRKKNDPFGFISHTMHRMGLAVSRLGEEEEKKNDVKDDDNITREINEYGMISALLVSLAEALRQQDFITLDHVMDVFKKDRVKMMSQSIAKKFEVSIEKATKVALEIEAAMLSISENISLEERKELISNLVDDVFSKNGFAKAGEFCNATKKEKIPDDSYEEIVKRAKEQLRNIKKDE
jgi:hypothetical protein